ncbi:MAG: iron-containing redox enzyme family protein [Terriglobales bacterium]
MTTQEFFIELDARIAQYDLLGHPFYKAWSAGELTREDLRNYGQNYFHHVNAFPEYLQAFASRLPQGEVRRAVQANHDDEMGGHGSRPHSELWLDFIEGMGDDRVAAAKPIAEIDSLVRHFHSAAIEGGHEEALATFYAYESQVPRVAAEKARGLKAMYGADAKTCEYFTLHTTADVYHSRMWKQQLAGAVAVNPEAAERALNAAGNAAKVLWDALDGIEAERMVRAA